MKRLLIATEDGSTTLQDDRTGETYHSTHGAIAESLHIYIQYGLAHFLEKGYITKHKIHLVEMGFGTGLNALLAYLEAEKRGMSIEYHTYELYPLSEQEVVSLRFHSHIEEEKERELLYQLHSAPWNAPIQIAPFFTLHKHLEDFTQAQISQEIDVIFFDAFSPNVQPELWTEKVFAPLFENQTEGGVLTTYCAKGIVRRTLQQVGYTVERLAGPIGKREVLRATKE